MHRTSISIRRLPFNSGFAPHCPVSEIMPRPINETFNFEFLISRINRARIEGRGKMTGPDNKGQTSRRVENGHGFSTYVKYIISYRPCRFIYRVVGVW